MPEELEATPAAAASENGALLDWIDTRDREKLHVLKPGTLYGLIGEAGNLVIQDTDSYARAPRSTHRMVVVLDAASWLDYWASWSEPELGPEAWSDPDERTITGILDVRSDEGEGMGWCGHIVTLCPEKTTDWKAWLANSGKLLGQEQFAEFIEDHLPQIVEPPGADMLEIAQSLQGAVKAEWKQARRLSDGQVGLSYVETANATAGQKGQLAIPAEFALALAPFKGGAPYKIKARFRYRIAGDQIALGYKLDRADDVEDAAWNDILTEVRDGLAEQPVTAFLRVGRP